MIRKISLTYFIWRNRILNKIEKWRHLQQLYASPSLPWKRKKQLRNCRNCLIYNVDQLGLEPRTSRLWVCCSNQLSYKSDMCLMISVCKSTKIIWIVQIIGLVFAKYWHIPSCVKTQSPTCTHYPRYGKINTKIFLRFRMKWVLLMRL